MDFKAGLDKRLIYNFDDEDLNEYLKNPLIPAAHNRKIRAAKGEDSVKLIRDLFILRWSPADISAGSIKLVDGTEYSLEEALQDNTAIKLDIVIPWAIVSPRYRKCTCTGKRQWITKKFCAV
jgi:hypothetical protein